MLRVPSLIKPSPRAAGSEGAKDRRVHLSDEDQAQYYLCSPVHKLAGFERWCRECVFVRDKDTGTIHRLTLWPGQRRFVADVVAGVWLLDLKARQLGITTAAAAVCAWRMVFESSYLIMVVNQEAQYAEDFVDRVRFIHQHLPPSMRMTPTVDKERRLYFGEDGKDCDLRAMVGGDKAARSFTGDLALFDEASRIPDFGETLAAILPALTRSPDIGRAKDGQIVCFSTSSGPEGDFKELWDRNFGEAGELLDGDGVGPHRFKPVFYSWRERPGRDADWFAERKRELDQISPVKIKQEFPSTVDEAWEYPEGRVYPLFTRARNIGTIDIPWHAKRFRAIDWGETKSAYVVLWIAYIEGPPGFLVHPDCTGTIREFMSYRLDDHGRPLKKNDHAPDAVRYAVTTHNLRGLLYVYREIHRLDSVSMGWNPMTEVAEIHELSGWRAAPPGAREHYVPGVEAETFELESVADPSMGKIIALFSEYGVPTIPASRLAGITDEGRKRVDPVETARVEGIKMVAALIDGSRDQELYYTISRRQALEKAVQRVERKPVAVSLTLEEVRLAEVARTLLGAADQRLE